MPWHALLSLHYHAQGGRTVSHHRHEGPLRIFKSLYPEGPAICHDVIVHPPGGIVAGDRLDIRIDAEAGTHALLSTPGATRFYASDGEPGAQHVDIRLGAGARLEWLPLETLAFPGCQAQNTLAMTLAEGAEMIGWDVLALGLPTAGQPFTRGRVHQRIAWPGVWLEQATIDGADQRLLDAPLGLGGRPCLGTLWLASARPLAHERREALLEAVRAVLPAPGGEVEAGATCPDPRVLLVRALAPLAEPLMATLQAAWAQLRQYAWGLPARPPRIWGV
jgi:urease accessory protein